MMRPFIKLHEDDNVVVALVNLQPGDELTIDEHSIVVKEEIKKGHKLAIKKIEENQDVVKYGFAIGHATQFIEVGTHVHTQNVKTNLNDCLSYEYQPKSKRADKLLMDREIRVYHRKNWDIGIRNELWIIPTVGCVNKTAEIIKDRFLKEVDNLTIDGVFSYAHPFGCSQMGDDHETTRKILQNIAKHPNAGGVLVLGLGCENNQVSTFKETMGEYDEERVRFLVAQDVEDEIEAGVKILHELYEVMKQDYRATSLLRNLRVGLKCGGSDGFSGITANPLLGYFSDYLVKSGGTTVLTEVPEMFGAETILMNRAKDEATFDKIVHLINDFKGYYERNHQVCYENPSPGNKAGGITTLEDKSLGCTQKAGTSEVVDVLRYTDRLEHNGLNLLQGPGNDLVAVTALGSAGCHLALFTTGRGTPFGGFIPTVKVATNSDLANKKKHWIDFDAGAMLTASTTEEVVEDFINYICDVCSGKWTNNEFNGHREIDIWKSGVTL
ncbi:altronate dehydratase [Turicibacter sanguinis]|nr:altronate dehydratase family protein [Turicibacter sanguinis]MBP3904808.1 altronate dehydratase [Turicibacter sp.]MCU7191791.1 altronate dehydratase family protein [Turicibacter sanguinis]MCU7212447.1 altronate dehydratase family protein [Turicibacter sanguinis]MTN80185.1 altronate dehydratase [Turicibacter sanguinis]MTN83058.1 altronate dehydratase [Turicibacter sanguinis]